MMGTVLVFGEMEAGDLTSGFWEQISAGRRLCEQTGWTMDVAVVGCDTGPAGRVASTSGADRVLVVDDSRLGDPWPEATAEVLADVYRKLTPDAIVMPRTVLGSEVSARLAFRFDVAMAMDVMSIGYDEDGLVVTRPVFGGAGTARLRIIEKPWIIVPRKGAFAAADPLATPTATPVAFASCLDDRVLRTTIGAYERQEAVGPDLERARVIVAGGRGVGGPESFEFLQKVADRLNGAVGASRPPCDSGWVEPMYQIGLTGKTVAPDLYMAVGISGATQHMTGCSSSQVIVAINNDPDAAIFRMASYGVVGDWKDVLSGFLESLADDTSTPLPDRSDTRAGTV
jgi:electron transfer flavoprotein alpha subunit